VIGVAGLPAAPSSRPAASADRAPRAQRESRRRAGGRGGPGPPLIFTGAKGAPLRRSNFQRTVKWTTSVTQVGLPGFHFHDLRHTGNTLASHPGASLADLMARMGHSSTRAALIYQHTARQRDKEIALSLSGRITRARDRARNGHGKTKKSGG
jgi:integrase